MAKQGLDEPYLGAIRTLLQRVMEEHGYNQKDVEEHVGIPQSQVSAILSPKKGTGLGVPGLIRLADFAGVSLDEAIGRTVPAAVSRVQRHPEADSRGTGSAAVRRKTKAKRGEDPADVLDQMAEQIAVLRERLRTKLGDEPEYHAEVFRHRVAHDADPASARQQLERADVDRQAPRVVASHSSVGAACALGQERRGHSSHLRLA